MNLPTKIRAALLERQIRPGEHPPGTIAFYHGGTKWHNRPEIRPARQGRYEGGPGIYLTTSYTRAVSYAGGSRVVQKVFVDKSRIKYADDVPISLEDATDFLKSVRIRRGKAVLEDLKGSFNRTGKLDAQTLVNLLVNYESLIGDSGPKLAQWLAERGVTASSNRMHSEHWLIVFDPTIIVGYHKVDPKLPKGFEFDLPLLG